MEQIVYRTKQEAQAACYEYEAGLEELQRKFGVTTIETSACGDTFATVEYLSEALRTETLWHPID